MTTESKKMLECIESEETTRPSLVEIAKLIKAIIRDVERTTERLDQIENFLSSWEAI